MTDEPALGTAWGRFWFTPMPTTAMAVLRISSGLLFGFWLLSFLGHHEAFFSLNGWLDMTAFQALRQEMQPADWSILYLAGESAGGYHAIYWTSVLVIVLFTLGVATRVTGVLTWVAVVSFTANPVTSYDGDYLLGILAFHLMVGHLLAGQWNGNLSLAERILGSKDDFILAGWLFPREGERPASIGANFMMRLLQVHVAIILVTSGLHKLQMGDWWSGIALWYPLHPPFQTTLETVQRGKATAPLWLFFLSMITYAVLAWQIAFPVFAWRRGVISRSLLLGGAALGWVGVLFLLKLPLFGPFFFLGALSFLSADEWAWIKRRAAGLVRRSAHASSERESAKPEPLGARAGAKK